MTRERDRSASAPREPPHRGPVRHFPTLVTRHPSSFLGPVRAGPAPAAGVVRERGPFAARDATEPGRRNPACLTSFVTLGFFFTLISALLPSYHRHPAFGGPFG